MSRILLIETSTDVCSVACSVDGQVVALVEEVETLKHAALLTIQVKECVHKAGFPLAALDAVAISSGPGSYTSLRVGASVAKGICYALEKPLIAIDTLLALAQASRVALSQEHQPTLFIPMLDARRQEVWTAIYDEKDQVLAAAQPVILEHNLFEVFMAEFIAERPAARLVFSGNGMEKLHNVPKLSNAVFSSVKKCSAQYMANLATQLFQNSDFQEVAYFEPFYMKPPNITIPKPM